MISDFDLDRIVRRRTELDQLTAALILVGLKKGAATVQAVSRDLDMFIADEQERIERRRPTAWQEDPLEVQA